MESFPIAIIGCGYVGSALAEALVGAGHDVVATTTSAGRIAELRSLGVRAELLDIADIDRLAALLADRQAVYLTIAPKHRGTDYRDLYLAAAQNLATAIARTRVRRVIYTSSTRVYGQNDGSWVDESSPTEPRDERGAILLDTENTLLGLGSGDCGPVAVSVVRLAGIHGPGREPGERARALAGTHQSGGDAYVNLIHRDDIVSALVALLDVPHHGLLNLSDDAPEPRRVFYDRMIAQSGLPAIDWIDDSSSRRTGKRVRNDRIKRLLDLKLAHPKH